MERSAARGYLVRCTECGREQMSGASPLVNGWPKCCGLTMRLEDTKRFIADVDGQVREAFDLARITGARL
jgi:predicted  nucleic acid-binding Zn-ribbon protein